MEKEKNEVQIRGKKCRIEFITPIGTWPGGGDYVEGEYKGVFEKEIVHLHLQIIEECSEYEEMGEPSQEEVDDGFKRSKKGQEKFFRDKGKKILIETLKRMGGIEGKRRLGCGKIPCSCGSHSKIATVVIKDMGMRKL